ncbi:MAG TPA: hypothetical protein VF021_11860 [Longimicrobiales bacterium]
MRAGGTLALPDASYQIRRESLFGPYVLADGERTIARARRAAFLKPSYHIIAEDRQLELVSRGFLMRRAQLLHGDVVLAEIGRSNFIRRDVRIDDAAASTPAPLLLFAGALLILFWRRQSRSSG